jgi:vancomycin resistance protein YoaR
VPANAPWPDGQAYPPPPRPARRRRGVAWEATLALLAIAVILAGVATVLIVELWMLDRVLPGVYAWNIDIGGMTRGEAIEQLAASFEYPLDRYLTLRDGDRTWVVGPEDLGARLDAAATVDAALAIGHRGDLLNRLQEQVEVLFDGRLVAPVLAFDPNAGAVFLSNIASQLDRPMRNATLSLNGDLSVEVVPGQAGRRVDVEATRQILVQHMAEMRGGEVELVMQTSEPLLADVSQAQAQVQRILSAPVVLTGPDSFSRTVEPATLASWLILRPVTGEDGQTRLTVSLDREHLSQLANELATQVETPPVDAQFRWDYTSGSLGVAVPSVPGRTLDVTSTVSLIEQTALSQERTVALPVLEVRPDLASEDGPSLGIVELIAEGVTSFAGSSASRVQNIVVGAQQFDGVLIPPGETFSFNYYLGEVTAEKGYEESIIIWGNETRADVGGGLCQVSSTAFRAAFWAGVPITERWAHAFRVSYYEPPKGLDATIYSPSVDLKWVNDTGHYILIHTYADRTNQTLTFHYFGTKPNRTVEMDGPYEANPVPHGPPVYREDPTLPPGETRQIEWPKDGLDVTVYRIIKENGVEIGRDTFFSRYQPWQAVYLVGTQEE